MKIKSIKLKDFKRFTDLTIEGLPETAKLVVMIGPNGCGKSSVFDALHRYKMDIGAEIGNPYYIKGDSSENFVKEPEVEFHTLYFRTEDERAKWVHVRSTYRSHFVDNISFGDQVLPITAEHRFNRMIEDDHAFASNYMRMMYQLMERSSASDQRDKNVGDLQDEIFGDLRGAIARLFNDPELILDSLGNPAEGNVFEFNKGTSQGFSYQNLSSGENASLDLLLDLIVAKVEFNDTVFCIDEPEAHIHTKLQGPLLEELYNLIPDNSQLWIATHSIGMVRKAQELWRKDSNSVVFLDFGKNETDEDRDFDGQERIKPAEPNPNFWAQTYEVALGDLAELVITRRTVFCEGENFDQECYRNIFKDTYPEVSFVSLGARGNVEKSVTAANLAIGNFAKSAKVIGIVDRDHATRDEIKRNAKKGIRTLSRTSIESYLLDDEVLTKLCEDHGASDKVNDLLTAKQDALNKFGLKSSDNLKRIVQEVHGAAQRLLEPTRLGNSKNSFMIDVLAPRIRPGMKVYEQLHEDIFGK